MSIDFDKMLFEAQRGTAIQKIIDEPPNAVASEHIAEFKKTDGKLQIAYAEVYAPNLPDAHGDFMVPDEIRKMAHAFLRAGLTKKVDVEHNNEFSGSAVVESFIARDSDPDFIPGSWVAGIHIPDAELWKQVESGEINGFSLQGMGIQTEKTVTLTVPSVVKGLTMENEIDGHWHAFEVRFNDTDGSLEGGQTLLTFPTDFADHLHLIKKGTVTEPGGDEDAPHVHRFSFVESLDAEIAS